MVGVWDWKFFDWRFYDKKGRGESKIHGFCVDVIYKGPLNDLTKEIDSKTKATT